MPLSKKELIEYSIEKSDQALKTAYDSLEKDLINSNNRMYYAIFYIVTALAYIDEFTTGSHHSLMGWFNKKYIYENKVFESKMSKIYTQLMRNREKFDYNIAEFPEKETTKENYEKALLFIDTLKAYIIKELEKLEG